MKNLYYSIIGLATLLAPSLAFAQFRSNAKTDKNFSTFSTFVYGLDGVFTTILLLIVAASFIAFLFGLAIRLIQIGNSDKRKEAGYIMIWGIIGLLVSISILGILNVGVATFSGFAV